MFNNCKLKCIKQDLLRSKCWIPPPFDDFLAGFMWACVSFPHIVFCTTFHKCNIPYILVFVYKINISFYKKVIYFYCDGVLFLVFYCLFSFFNIVQPKKCHHPYLSLYSHLCFNVPVISIYKILRKITPPKFSPILFTNINDLVGGFCLAV